MPALLSAVFEEIQHPLLVGKHSVCDDKVGGIDRSCIADCERVILKDRNQRSPCAGLISEHDDIKNGILRTRLT